MLKKISQILGKYLSYLAAALCIPWLTAAYYQYAAADTHPQPHSTKAFFLTLLICLTLSALLKIYGSLPRTKQVLYAIQNGELWKGASTQELDDAKEEYLRSSIFDTISEPKTTIFEELPPERRKVPCHRLSNSSLDLRLKDRDKPELPVQFAKHETAATLYRRESILIVVLLWIATSVVSALPFYLSNTLSNPLDAYFEAISGLTTTGATMLCPKAYNPITGEEIPIHITEPMLPDKTYTYWGTVAPVRDKITGLILYSSVEAVSKALLLWRSLLQWIGGMGIVVIFLTVLPALGVGGKFLYQIEMTGPVKEGLAPRVKETAARLWKLYLFLTLSEIALLLITNQQMPFFDAVCTSLSSVSTGGFSVRNQNIGAYKNVATESVIMVFMIIGSINFSLFFHAMRLKFFRIYVPDFFLFLGIAAAGCIAISLILVGSSVLDGTYSIQEAFRLGCFQSISMQTSTGFFTANYNLWPFSTQMFLLLLMFIGGMSGSTAGGIKTSRFYILYKIVLHRLESIYRPDSVRKLKIANAEIDDKNSLTVLSFFCIAAFFTVCGTVLFVFDGIDPETSLGLTACFLNNAGGAFQAAGPLNSFSFLPPFSKILATFWMLLGRLEFYVVLLLFLPAFWKNR